MSLYLDVRILLNMKIGMTGSRDGITTQAYNSFIACIKLTQINEAHHGDCIGADALFHNIMQSLNVPIVIHPPDIDTLRAYCMGGQVLPKKPYLSRNQDIVNCSDLLVAFPSTKEEVVRSGTWSTIRYAQKVNKPVMIFYPDGTF
jgi:hypothetical protein